MKVHSFLGLGGMWWLPFVSVSTRSPLFPPLASLYNLKESPQAWGCKNSSNTNICPQRPVRSPLTELTLTAATAAKNATRDPTVTDQT